MPNSYGPDEARTDVLTERAFLAGDFIAGMGFGELVFWLFSVKHTDPFVLRLSGMQVIMYISCAQYLWRTRKDRKHSLTILSYITLLLIIQTILCVVKARTVQVMYVDNRNYPGGPWAYFLNSQEQAIDVMFYACLFVLTFLSDLLVVSISIPIVLFVVLTPLLLAMEVLGCLDCIRQDHSLFGDSLSRHHVGCIVRLVNLYTTGVFANLFRSAWYAMDPGVKSTWIIAL